MIEATSGVVHAEAPGQQPPTYVLSNNRCGKNITRECKTKTNGVLQLSAKVTKPKQKISAVSRTGVFTLASLVEESSIQGEEPVQGITVRFELSPPTLGAISAPGQVGGAIVEVKTDSQGDATITFNAGPDSGDGTITATAAGARNSVSWTVKVLPPFPFWIRQHKVLLGIGAAAAVAVPVVLTTGGKREIKLVPPPIIIP